MQLGTVRQLADASTARANAQSLTGLSAAIRHPFSDCISRRMLRTIKLLRVIYNVHNDAFKIVATPIKVVVGEDTDHGWVALASVPTSQGKKIVATPIKVVVGEDTDHGWEERQQKNGGSFHVGVSRK